MYRSARNAVMLAVAMALAATVLADEGGQRPGHAIQPADFAAWDIDIRYDGAGLPPGQGTVERGEEIYAEQCAACHGGFGEGVGRIPALTGESTVKRRIGSLWPYAPTLFDYIRRAMPFGDAQSLSVDEVYSLTALVLNMNGLWDDDGILDQRNLPGVEMPNRNGFILSDPRPDTRNTRCMRDCANEVRILSKAVLVENKD